MAQIRDHEGDEAGAIEQLQRAIEELRGDARAYAVLGEFLRAKGHPAEAVEVLEVAIDVSDAVRVDLPLLTELGLAYADAGRDADAIRTLEDVLKVALARGGHELPPIAAVALAQAHERAGRLERAADLYRTLSQGGDRERHAVYHTEAARLLEALGLEDEAHRMRERARAIEAGRAARGTAS